MSTQITPVTDNATGRLEIMNKTGDLKVEWNKDVAVEVAAAKAQFDLMRGKGYAAFRLNSDGTKGEQIDAFDLNAKRILLAPPMSGG